MEYFVVGHGKTILKEDSEKHHFNSLITIPKGTTLVLYSRGFTPISAGYSIDILRLNKAHENKCLQTRKKTIQQNHPDYDMIICSENMTVPNMLLGDAQGQKLFESETIKMGKAVFKERFITIKKALEKCIWPRTYGNRKVITLKTLLEQHQGHTIHLLACRSAGANMKYASKQPDQHKLYKYIRQIQLDLSNLPSSLKFVRELNRWTEKIRPFKFHNLSTLKVYSKSAHNVQSWSLTTLANYVEIMKTYLEAVLVRIEKINIERYLTLDQQAQVKKLYIRVVMLFGHVHAHTV